MIFPYPSQKIFSPAGMLSNTLHSQHDTKSKNHRETNYWRKITPKDQFPGDGDDSLAPGPPASLGSSPARHCHPRCPRAVATLRPIADPRRLRSREVAPGRLLLHHAPWKLDFPNTLPLRALPGLRSPSPLPFFGFLAFVQLLLLDLQRWQRSGDPGRAPVPT